MPSLFALPQQTPHERVLVAADAATGLRTLIALHSTARGPGFGGCRFWAYENDLAAHHDALRLSQALPPETVLREGDGATAAEIAAGAQAARDGIGR